jgi:hypothetical protein
LKKVWPSWLPNLCIAWPNWGNDCDCARDIAVWYPLRVIMMILGVPRENEALMLRLTQEHFFGGGADPDMNKGQKKDATSAVRGFFEYFRSLTNERRKAPKDDLASLLANAEIDGKPISDFDRNSRYILSGDSRPRYDEFVDFGPPARAPRPPRSTRQVTRRSVSRIFGGKREHSLGDAGQVFLQNGYAGLHLSGAGHQERTVLDALLLVRKSRRGNMRQTFHFSRRP